MKNQISSVSENFKKHPLKDAKIHQCSLMCDKKYPETKNINKRNSIKECMQECLNDTK